MRTSNAMTDDALLRLHQRVPLPRGYTFGIERAGSPRRPRLYVHKRDESGGLMMCRELSPRCTNRKLVAYIDAFIDGAEMADWLGSKNEVP